MAPSLELTRHWRLIYAQLHRGNLENKRYRIPLIEPIEFGFTVPGHIFAVSAVWINSRPTWFTAGYLSAEVNQVNLDDTVAFSDLGQSPTAITLDRKRVTLNTLELAIFPKLASEVRLLFEPMHWIEQITLAVWEYIGPESDSTEELIDALRVDLARVEFKLDNR